VEGVALEALEHWYEKCDFRRLLIPVPHPYPSRNALHP